MSAALDHAMKRLEQTLGLLEASIARRLEMDARRADLELELQLMQDDRVKLAEELDGTATRLERVEAVTGDVTERVQKAVGAVQVLLADVENTGRNDE